MMIYRPLKMVVKKMFCRIISTNIKRNVIKTIIFKVIIDKCWANFNKSILTLRINKHSKIVYKMYKWIL